MDRVRNGPESVKVYRKYNTVDRVCDRGFKHRGGVYMVKRIKQTEETVNLDNGYEKYTTKVYVDTQGRRYYRHMTIDYFDNTYYVRMKDDKPDGIWKHRLTTNEVAEDMFGNPL